MGRTPPFVLAKMRELAERYYREHPEAAATLRLLDHAQRKSSGHEPIASADIETRAATGSEKA